MRCVRCGTEIDQAFKACPHCGEPVTDFLRRYHNEPVDGKYEIVSRIGTGGMGEVYKVRHTYLGTLRVVKVIRPQISEHQETHDRFLREARLATKVQHPNVATLHDFSALPDGSHYMVWEYIEGEDLAKRLRHSGTLAPATAARIAIDALHGLEAIHRAGIVHRDISPENIMLTPPDDRVKIIDLGVAKGEETTDSATKTGMFVGKFRYASPEHLGMLEDGQKIDGRADLYSLAVVLYEMLAGRPPFEATSPHQYFVHHSRDTQIAPIAVTQHGGIDAELQQILARALDRDRNKRYSSAAEFAAALEGVEPRLRQTTSTVAVPFDGDTTMKIADKPANDAAPTVRTPLPQPVPSAAAPREYSAALTAKTVREPLAAPMLREETAPAARTGGAKLPWIVAIIAVVALIAVIAILLVTRRHPAEVAGTASIPPQPATAAPPSSTMEVTQPAVSTAAAATAPVPATQTAPAVVERPRPAATQTAEAAPTTTRTPPTQTAETTPPASETVPETAPAGRNYVEGGDSDANDAALTALRDGLAGVSSIAVRGPGPQAIELANLLRSRITVADDAEVVIHFRGVLEHLGRGRKRRGAEAVVMRKGRVLFHYVLPPEVYRVGDTPAEAFSRVFGDAINR